MARHAVLASFYASAPYQRFRSAVIAERGPRCQKCQSIIPNPTDIHLHHTIELTPENYRDTTISLNPKNVLVLCRTCHDATHQRFGYEGTGRKVYIVYGPPLSGKSTFVAQRAKRGDLVVDMDRLFEAVSLLPEYDKPDSLLSNVLGVHDLLIDNIKTRHGKWGSAWIVGGYAEKYRRERLADELSAEMVFCDVSKQECLARLEMDVRRRMRKAEWAGYVEKWFEQYRA